MEGKVKFFNKEKGFGFIEAESVDKDIFVGARGLEVELNEGDKVSFELEDTPRGKAATNVAHVEEADAEE